MKLSDILVSAIIKKGILYEARNVDATIDIPVRTDTDDMKTITVRIKSEHMTLRVEKGE